jgi:hypothetical protein
MRTEILQGLCSGTALGDFYGSANVSADDDTTD